MVLASNIKGGGGGSIIFTRFFSPANDISETEVVDKLLPAFMNVAMRELYNKKARLSECDL